MKPRYNDNYFEPYNNLAGSDYIIDNYLMLMLNLSVGCIHDELLQLSKPQKIKIELYHFTGYLRLLVHSQKAKQNFAKYGIKNLSDEEGEIYLRMYGIFNAANIQRETLGECFRTLISKKKGKRIKKELDKQDIMFYRHSLASHGANKDIEWKHPISNKKFIIENHLFTPPSYYQHHSEESIIAYSAGVLCELKFQKLNCMESFCKFIKKIKDKFLKEYIGEVNDPADSFNEPIFKKSTYPELLSSWNKLICEYIKEMTSEFFKKYIGERGDNELEELKIFREIKQKLDEWTDKREPQLNYQFAWPYKGNAPWYPWDS